MADLKYTEADVDELSDVIAHARSHGINAGGFTLARFILDHYGAQSLCGVPHLTGATCLDCLRIRKQ